MKKRSYFISIVFASACLAFSLPYVLSVLTGSLPGSSSGVENDKTFPAALAISAAGCFVLLFNLMRGAFTDRRLARSAQRAGLVDAVSMEGLFPRKKQEKLKAMKEQRAAAGEIMIIGSTGVHSFVLPEGDLHEAVRRCREAKIMLLDPREHGAIARAQTMPDPEITPVAIREQVMKSIEFIKGVRGPGKTVRLKLYPDMPLFKMAILGGCAYVRHYHTGLNVRSMPEFVFQNTQHDGGLYLPMCRYFLSQWQDPDTPEYDLDSDEVVYRDQLGYEVLRESFDGITISCYDDQRMETERSYFR